MRTARVIAFLVPAVALAPSFAFAQTISQIVGYLDIFVGLFLTVSLIMFGAALVVYFVRYGTARREEMFPYMQGSITILFVLSVVLALIRLFQRYTASALYALGVIVFFAVVILIIRYSGGGEKKEEGGH